MDGVDVRDTSALHEDLYLACACVEGAPAALRAFDAAFGDEFATLHRRFGYLPGGPDDVRQFLYEKLFVGETPKILQYTGRGSLRTWLRVAITRTLINSANRAPREVPAAEEILDALPEPNDPETAHLRRVHAEAFRAAFADAVERLGYRDRNMLRYAIVENLGLDEIAKIYSVHRATVTRWMSDAKEALASMFREAMKERLRIGDTELESLLIGMRSQLDVTLAHHLAKKA